jgi:hypothetical protein
MLYKKFNFRHCQRIVDTTQTTFPILLIVSPLLCKQLKIPESITLSEKKQYSGNCTTNCALTKVMPMKKAKQALKDLLHNEEGGHEEEGSI